MNFLYSAPFMSPSEDAAGRLKCFGQHRHRSAMTLVEMLVATAMTLIMMALVAQLFGMLGKGVNGSRNRVELYSRLRATGQRLKEDLNGITVRLEPPIDPDDGVGYFEYIEGAETDSVAWGAPGLGTLESYPLAVSFSKSNLSTQENPDNELSDYIATLDSDDRLVGDVDDVLLFTTRSTGAPFAGKLDSGIIESPVTEVVWFCQVVPNTFNPRQYNLYRRQRIVMGNPAKNVGSFSEATNDGIKKWNTVYLGDAFVQADTPAERVRKKWMVLEDLTDISCRMEGNYAVPNTLGDLTKRQNRFCHTAVKPYIFDPASDHLRFAKNSGRYVEDLILSNCIGFDVKIFDDTASAVGQAVDTTLVVPGDPGFSNNGSNVFRSHDSGSTIPIYVDLGLLGTNGSGFLYSPGNNPMEWPTYDTWSTTYLSDNAMSIPYEDRVRGLEVRIRCFEPATRAVIQLTVRESFN